LTRFCSHSIYFAKTMPTDFFILSSPKTAMVPIMRIEVTRPRTLDASRRAGVRGSVGGFGQLIEADHSIGVAALAPPLVTAQLADLVMLQAADGAAERQQRNSQAHTAARAMLDELQALQKALTLNNITGSNVSGLSQRIADSSRNVAASPALAAIATAIEVRVAVERAKLEMAYVLNKNETKFGALSAPKQAAIGRAE
jgi:Class II flagellar assembly regulator